MLELLKRFGQGFLNLLNGSAQAAADAWDEQEWPSFLRNVAMVLALLASAVGISVLITLFAWQFRKFLLALAIPPAMLAVLIASYFENHGKSKVSQSTPAQSFDEVEARARKTYPLMKQSAYLLLRELCRYLPGLVPPFALSSVISPVPFDITASLVPIFHFVVAKGEAETSCMTIKEILESLIEQHLQAQDLPLSVPAIYTDVNGNTWPGMVVDNVYDIGQHYRVDFAIMNEAEAARLKGKAVSRLESCSMDVHSFRDEDFD